MTEKLPEQALQDLEKARSLHDRAAADYSKCKEFNQLMGEILTQLEDAGCYKAADKVMTLLLDCNPKEGAQCDKSSMVGEKVKKLG